jgi:hypothetical protein
LGADAELSQSPTPMSANDEPDVYTPISNLPLAWLAQARFGSSLNLTPVATPLTATRGTYDRCTADS